MGSFTISPEEFLVRSTAQDLGVDPDQAARIAHAESGFDQTAVSPKGARGVMQLMPTTAKDLGVDPGDMASNIEGGVRYYKTLLDRYNGDERKAAAAYNAGPERVDSGKPLPAETQAYIDKVAPVKDFTLSPEDFLKSGPKTSEPTDFTLSPEDFLKSASTNPTTTQVVAPSTPVAAPAPGVIPGMERLGGVPPAAGQPPPVPSTLQPHQHIVGSLGQFQPGAPETGPAPTREQLGYDPQFAQKVHDIWTGAELQKKLAVDPAVLHALPPDIRTAIVVAQTAAGLASPENLATMIATDGMAGAFKAAANTPRLAKLLADFPGVRQAIDKAASAAIPATFSGLSAYQGVKGGVEAVNAHEQGDDDKATQYATQAVTNLIFAALGAVGTHQAIKGTAAAYPTAEASTGRAATPEVEELLKKSGATAPPTPAQQEAAGQVAQVLQQRGQNLAAQSWQNIADWDKFNALQPIQIGSDGYVLERNTKPGQEPLYSLKDSSGKVVVRGSRETVRDHIQQMTIAPTGQQVTGEAGPQDTAAAGQTLLPGGGPPAEPAPETKPLTDIVSGAQFQVGTRSYTVKAIENGKVTYSMEGATSKPVTLSVPLAVFQKTVAAANPAENKAAPETSAVTSPQATEEFSVTPEEFLAKPPEAAQPQAQAPAASKEEVISQPTAQPEAAGATQQIPQYQEMVDAVREAGKASTSTLQRKFRIGYGAASQVLDQMEKDGIIGPSRGSEPREVFAAGNVPRGAGPDEQLAAQPAPEAQPPTATAPSGNEQKKGAAEPPKLSSTQVSLPPDVAEKALAWSKRLPANALHDQGRETEPHVTVRYGIHDEDPAGTTKALEGEGPITAKLGAMSVFKGATPEDPDVLKIDVASPDLHRLNAKVGELPHTDTYPQYVPHITLGYFKRGAADKYVGKIVPGVSGKTITLNKVTFSSKNGQKTEIPLGGKVETPETHTVADGATYKDVRSFWDRLKAGDTIQTPRGDLEVTGAHAFNMQPVLPTRGGLAPIGHAAREVTDVTVKMPDGTERKFGHAGALHDFASGKKEEAAPQPATVPVPKTATAKPADLVLAGNTYPSRYAIKRLGAKWNKKDQTWSVADTEANRAAVKAMKGVEIQGGEAEKTTAPVINANAPSIGSKEQPFYTQEGAPVYSKGGEWFSYDYGRWFPLEHAQLNEVIAQFRRGDLLAEPPKDARIPPEAKRGAEERAKTLEGQAAEIRDKQNEETKLIEGRQNALTKAIDELHNTVTNRPEDGQNHEVAVQLLEKALKPAREFLEKLPDATEASKKTLSDLIEFAQGQLDDLAKPRVKEGDVVVFDTPRGPQKGNVQSVTKNGVIEVRVPAVGDKAARSVLADPSQIRKVNNEPLAPAEGEPTIKPEQVREPNARAGEDRGPLAEVSAEHVQRPEAEREAGPSGAERGSVDEGSVRPSDRTGDESGHGEGSDQGAVGVPAGRKPSPASRRDTDPRRGVGVDYRITDADQIGKGSLKEKASGNLEAIRTLKAIESESREATPEEQKILAKYVGWGGMPQPFQESWAVPRDWEGVRAELDGALTPEEFASARASTPNAHYTSPEVIKGMWDAAKRLGLLPEGGQITVLEPSMGVGSFFGLMPEGTEAQRVGIELDSITGRIAKLLYPNADVHVAGFEKVRLPNDYFDLAISNVPFGNYPIFDPAYKRSPGVTRSIHDYFFAKALDKVRPGGVVAFITSSYTMDKQDPFMRDYLAQKADLLGAIRLPNTAFKSTAGTEVTTDVIFLQKRAPEAIAAGGKWTNLASIEGERKRPDGSMGPVQMQVNEYYAAHPDMMLGKMSMEGSMYSANTPTLSGTMTPATLAAVVNKLPENVVTEWQAPQETFDSVSSIPASGELKDGAYTLKDGKILVRVGDQLRPTNLPNEQIRRVSGQIKVRDAVYDVFRTQLAGDSEDDIAAAMNKLNTAYDAFVRNNGPLHKKENAKAFADDPDAPVLLALEDWDKETQKAKKADIFSKRVIDSTKPATSADNAKDALSLSLNEKGRIDWARMQELTGRTPKEMQEELGPLVYMNPAGKAWEPADEYLSGNVRSKLAEAETAARADRRFERNVEALKAVQPKDLLPGEIKARLGSSWIPKDDVRQFVSELLDVPLRAVTVGHSEGLGSWTLTLSQKDTVANNRTWGTNRFRGSDLIDDALNLRSPTAYDTVKDEHGERRIINDKETLAAREMQKQIKDKFSEWAWADTPRAERLAEIYNHELNSDRLWQPDGSHLTFPGMAIGLKLRPHQKNGIWRIVRGDGNVLLAHTVGSGKTLEIVGGAMELRRLGKSRKPMVVVPNNRVGGTADEWLRAYPSANILTIGGEDFTPEQRQQMMARIATGNWDGVIASYEAFVKVPVSDETFNGFIDKEIHEYEGFIREAKADKSDAKIVKQLEKAKKRLEAKIRTKRENIKKDTGISFEDLGVDSLFVDEADSYKNLAFASKMDRISGIPNTESQRAFDMYMKTQYIANRNNGRGIIFATGTPVANSMAEVWTMQRYLQPKYLKDHGLQHFDSWAQTFGEVNPALEMTPDGTGVRVTNKFNKFVNMPELMKGFRQIADVQTAKMLKLPVPRLKGGRPTIVSAKASPAQQAYLQALAARAKRVKGKKPMKGSDNILVIGTDGQKAAVDIRLVDPSQPDNPDSKVNMAVDRIVDTWEKTTANKSTQIVFLDMSTPQPKGKSQGFSVYEDMRDKLIRRGIPKKEIAFIQDYKGDDAKEELFAAMNSGKVRVLFGSTGAAGVGVNVQKKLIAQHQLDAPYRPRDVEQREGRILRQGNENPEIEIIRYVTEPSFDARKWDILQGKAAYINAFMEGDMTVREMEDISDAELSYGEIAAIASGNPAIREKVLVDTEIRKLDAMRSRYEQQEYAIRRDLQALPGNIAAAKLEKKKAEKDLDTRDSTSAEFTISKKTLKGEDARKEASAALADLLEKRFNEKAHDFGYQTFAIGSYHGFRLVGQDFAQTDGSRREANILIQGELTYTSIAPSPTGAVASIEGKVRNIEAQRDYYARDIEQSEKKLADTKAIAGKSFEQAGKLQQLLERQAELEKILQTKEADTSAVGGDEDSEGDPEDLQDLQEMQKAKLSTAVKGTENGPIAAYKVGRGTLKSPEGMGTSTTKDGWLTAKTDEGRALYSDGHFMLEGEAPGSLAETSEGVQKSMLTYLSPDIAPKPVSAVAFAAPIEKGAAKTIWFSDGTAIDAKYYDHILKAYPDASFGVGKQPSGKDAIFVKNDDRTVGVVMPIAFKAIPEAVRPFVEPETLKDAQEEAAEIAERRGSSAPDEPIALAREAPGLYTGSMRKSVMEGRPLFAKSRQIAADANVPQTPTTYRHGVLWVGSQTMNAITETLGLGRNVAAGMYVPPSRALALQKVVTGPLHEAIADALREGNSLVIVRHDAGTPISKSIALARHELFHAAEDWMGQAQRGHTLLENPLASKAAETLKHIGYSDIPSILFSEIGAHLAEGPLGWQKLDLKPEEAQQLWKEYLALTPASVVAKLDRIAPQLKEELYAAQALRNAEVGLDTRGGRENETPEEGAGRGPVRRGVQEALSREQQTPYERSARLEKAVAMANALDAVGATPEEAAALTDDQWKLAADAGQVQPPHSQATKDEVVKQLKLIRQIRAQSGERGSAPMLGDLSQYLADKFGKDAPKVNYSGIGAFERIALPGKQLSEIAKASPRVFKAAIRAAGSESYASTLMRSSIPAIKNELKDSGHSWEELELYYVESRLRGLRARWQNFADQASAMTPDELQDAMKENADGSGSAFLDLLSKIEGRQGLAQDLGQTAAALAHAGEWDTLAEFLNQTFRDAADRVAHAMEDAEFDYIQDAVATDPQMKEADRLYGELLEKPMAESHSLNEGVFSDALGPANRYFPLMAAAREQVSPSGRRLPYRKPKNQSNAFATGLSESYDISMDAFAKKLSGAIRGNNKAALIDALLKQKWAVPESQAWTNEENQLVMDGPDGNEYLATREESSPGRTLIQGRKTIRIPAHFIVMPKFVNRALRPILAREPMDPNSVIALMRWANNLATKGPLELIFHTNGVMGALYANTPFLGESLPAKLLSAPIAKWFDIRRRMYLDWLLGSKYHLKNDPLDPSSPENVQKLLEMSQAGALPARSGKVTYSKKIAEETGAKLERLSFAPLLYGPQGLDARARILMYDIWKAAYPNGDVQSLHHFVNQIGNYIPELQGEIEKWFKHVGLGPFATAGMTRVVNGIHTFTGTGPGPGGTWKSRLWWWMTASGAAALAIWAIAHKELTGKWPMQDPRAKLFQIPVGGGSGPIDKFRHSKLGDARWGKNNNVGYLNFSFLDNPLSMRGARALGLRAAFDTLNLKGTPGQAAEAANSDVINSFAEPALGPFTRAAIVLGTGSTPYLTGFRDYRTGRSGISFMPAIPAKTKPGWPTAGERALSAAKQLNSLGAEAAENLGGLTGLYSPDQELPKGAGSWWMRSVLDLAAPGLFGNSGNPYAKRTSLRQQQRALGVR